MLKKLYLLQTYLIIIRCSSERQDETAEPISTTISIQDRVNQEVSPFVKLLDDFRNAQNGKVDELKGRIIGKLEGHFKEMIKQIVEERTNADQRLKKEGKLENKMENIKLRALRTFVVPYLCRNLELYESAWDCGGQNSLNFNPDDFENTEVKRYDLDTQTLSNYKNHAKIWDRILQSSTHPLVKIFKNKIKLLYPGLSLPIIAKNLGLAHALLNNAKHGPTNDDPDLKTLVNPDDLVLALKKWEALKDPVVLNIIKTFEQVISGL